MFASAYNKNDSYLVLYRLVVYAMDPMPVQTPPRGMACPYDNGHRDGHGNGSGDGGESNGNSGVGDADLSRKGKEGKGKREENEEADEGAMQGYEVPTKDNAYLLWVSPDAAYGHMYPNPRGETDHYYHLAGTPFLHKTADDANTSTDENCSTDDAVIQPYVVPLDQLRHFSHRLLLVLLKEMILWNRNIEHWQDWMSECVSNSFPRDSLDAFNQRDFTGSAGMAHVPLHELFDFFVDAQVEAFLRQDARDEQGFGAGYFSPEGSHLGIGGPLAHGFSHKSSEIRMGDRYVNEARTIHTDSPGGELDEKQRAWKRADKKLDHDDGNDSDEDDGGEEGDGHLFTTVSIPLDNIFQALWETLIEKYRQHLLDVCVDTEATIKSLKEKEADLEESLEKEADLEESLEKEADLEESLKEQVAQATNDLTNVEAFDKMVALQEQLDAVREERGAMREVYQTFPVEKLVVRIVEEYGHAGIRHEVYAFAKKVDKDGHQSRDLVSLRVDLRNQLVPKLEAVLQCGAQPPKAEGEESRKKEFTRHPTKLPWDTEAFTTDTSGKRFPVRRIFRSYAEHGKALVRQRRHQLCSTMILHPWKKSERSIYIPVDTQFSRGVMQLLPISWKGRYQVFSSAVYLDNIGEDSPALPEVLLKTPSATEGGSQGQARKNEDDDPPSLACATRHSVGQILQAMSPTEPGTMIPLACGIGRPQATSAEKVDHNARTECGRVLHKTGDGIPAGARILLKMRRKNVGTCQSATGRHVVVPELGVDDHGTETDSPNAQLPQGAPSKLHEVLVQRGLLESAKRDPVFLAQLCQRERGLLGDWKVDDLVG